MSTSSRFAVAVHVLTLMAWSDDEPLKSEQVAESVNTNPVVIRRILCDLAEATLVVSQTGAMGGSRLARRAEEITLLDVYQAVNCGGVFSLHRQHPSRHCPVGVNIETVMGEVLDEVNSAVGHVLAKITIRDIVLRLRPCASPAGSKEEKLKLKGESLGVSGDVKQTPGGKTPAHSFRRGHPGSAISDRSGK